MRQAEQRQQQQQQEQQSQRPSLPDLDRVAALVTGAKERLLNHPGIPSEEDAALALRVCAEAADLVMDAAVQPQLSSRDHQSDTAASTLLSLDDGPEGGGGDGGARLPAHAHAQALADGDGTLHEAALTATRFRDVVQQTSAAAFAVVEDPRVNVTRRLLEQYVQLQARLGRPETLPHVLHLYAAKPQARAGSTAAAATATTPSRRASRAVDAGVATAALDAALAARNLDAAVGVVEHTFAAPAFVRAKLLRHGLLPAFVVVGVPLATYSLATRLAAWQTTMDDTTATHAAFAAILAYIAFTGAMGVVANATANDQMRRVTWAPGTPLRERWLREDERAALDRVACAFGFSEEHRYGEEEGAEFQALREYIMRKGMLIDQIELMEGMSS